MRLRPSASCYSTLSSRERAVLVCATAASVGDSYCALAWGRSTGGPRRRYLRSQAIRGRVAIGCVRPVLARNKIPSTSEQRKSMARRFYTVDVTALMHGDLSPEYALERTHGYAASPSIDVRATGQST